MTARETAAEPGEIATRSAATERVVEIVYEGAPGRRVELFGDFADGVRDYGAPDFRVAHPLVEERPGFYRIAFDAGAGVYRYKLQVDGVWTLDPRCPLVDTTEGVDNNVVVVGNLAAPPVFFPDDARHRSSRGRHVRLEIADDTTPPPPIAGHVVEVLRRGGRRFFARDAARTSSASHVFYGIFLDRWRRSKNAAPDRRVLARTTPSTPFVFYGGDLEGVRTSLPMIADLGVTAVVISPVSLSESPHRYDAVDPLVVDPRLGGEQAFARLVESARAAGLKLVVDVSLTHVSHRHAAFRDLLEKQEASAFRSWFLVKRFPVRERDRETVEHYFNASDQPWLNLDDDGAAAHALASARRLIELGADGLRLDAMDEAPLAFWRRLAREVRAVAPRALLLGECVTDALWHKAGVADVVTDFRIRDALLDFVARRTIDAREYVERTTLHWFRTGAFPRAFRVGFIDNLDTARFLSLADERRTRVALALLLFAEESAWITYGTELELAARRGERALDNAWLERLPMPSDDRPTLTRDLIRNFCRARGALAGHAVVVVEASGSRLVLRRGSRMLRVDVAEGEPQLLE